MRNPKRILVIIAAIVLPLWGILNNNDNETNHLNSLPSRNPILAEWRPSYSNEKWSLIPEKGAAILYEATKNSIIYEESDPRVLSGEVRLYNDVPSIDIRFSWNQNTLIIISVINRYTFIVESSPNPGIKSGAIFSFQHSFEFNEIINKLIITGERFGNKQRQ